MNSAPYTEPKFPPADEYSNYIPPHSTDYYRNNVHPYGYGTTDYRRYEIEEKYTPNNLYNSVSSVNCTDTENLVKRGSHPQASHPQQSPPQAHVQNQSQNQNQNSTNNRLNGFNSSSPPDSPEESGSPESVPSPGGQDSPESTGTTDSNRKPVIYPWMRKSQNNNNSGELLFFCTVKRFLFLYLRRAQYCMCAQRRLGSACQGSKASLGCEQRLWSMRMRRLILVFAGRMKMLYSDSKCIFPLPSLHAARIHCIMWQIVNKRVMNICAGP